MTQFCKYHNETVVKRGNEKQNRTQKGKYNIMLIADLRYIVNGSNIFYIIYLYLTDCYKHRAVLLLSFDEILSTVALHLSKQKKCNVHTV